MFLEKPHLDTVEVDRTESQTTLKYLGARQPKAPIKQDSQIRLMSTRITHGI